MNNKGKAITLKILKSNTRLENKSFGVMSFYNISVT